MTQVYKDKPPSPKQAFRRTTQLDKLLDPELLKALAEPTRAKLLSCLLQCGRACSVTEVAACCSVDFSMVARHLATMNRAGLLSCEKQGRTVWYSADGAKLSGYFRALGDAVEDIEPGSACCGGEGSDQSCKGGTR